MPKLWNVFCKKSFPVYGEEKLQIVFGARRLQMVKRSSLFCFVLTISGWMYAETVGIIGGYSGVITSGIENTPYAALIDSSGAVLPLSNLPSDPPYAYINTVSMNSSGYSIMGGNEGGVRFSSSFPCYTYMALVDPAGNVQKLDHSQNNTIFSSAINSSGNAVVVGGNGGRFGVRVDPQGNVTSLSLLGGGGTVLSAAINDSNLAVLGGDIGGYASLIQPGSTTDSGYVLTNQGITSVSINALGNSIIAGPNYARFFDSSGALIAPVILSGSPSITSAAINDTNLSLIGGLTGGPTPYASLVDLSGIPTPLSGLPSNGTIFSVDINSFGYGIIGGQDESTTSAYASFVDPSGVIYPISGLPVGSGASINSVAINDWGMALLGGTSDGSLAYAALASPWGGFSPLPVNSSHVIYSVSIRNFVPSNNLSGNNLAFAEYINDYARDKIRYFIPSLFAGTFNQALESAAPTRNAISLFTADNNMFYLNHSLSYHLRNHRHFKNRKDRSLAFTRTKTGVLDPAPADRVETAPLNELLTASQEISSSQVRKGALAAAARQEKPLTHSLWTDIIGVIGSQDAQHQTPAFTPSLGGFILGFDEDVSEEVEVGGGAAYTSTHIDEDHESGYSNIEQGYLFTYATWSHENFYLDGALWAGFFNIYQERHIHITGGDFISTSRPGGYQLSPHLEFGYNYTKSSACCSAYFKNWILDPFVMFDWVNAWQGRYEEVGPSPFNAGQKAHYSSFLRSEVGLRFYEQFAFCFWRLILEQKLSYVNKSPFGVGKVNAYLVGSPGSFTVETLTSLENLGAVEMGFIFEPANHAYPYGSISYQGEFNGSSQLHQITVELSLDF
jgi:hypothetical protein